MSPAFDEVRVRLNDAVKSVDDSAHRLETLLMRATQILRRRADSLGRRLSPARLSARVSAAKVKFNVLCAARDAAVSARLDDARARLGIAAASLHALSPLAVMERGYAMALDERGKLLRRASESKMGDRVRLRLAQGVLQCRVEEVEN
jgi:exodeoxyribonuclease VII large subunit